MSVQSVLDLLIANLPMIMSVLAALGLWKMAAGLIRLVVAKAEALAAATPNKVDDLLVHVVGHQLEELANLIETGKLDEAKELLKLVKASAKPVKDVK